MAKRHKRLGVTMVEALVASVLTVMTVGTASSVWIAGASSWYRGAGKINTETESRQAVRLVCRELSEAMDVVVDPDGQGITFHKPGVDENGEYRTDVTGQPQTDGINRRIFLQDGQLLYFYGGGTRTLAKGIITTDPLSEGGAAPYKVFTAGAGQIARQLTVMVATSSKGSGNETVKSRKREIVFLRNIYDTTR